VLGADADRGALLGDRGREQDETTPATTSTRIGTSFKTVRIPAVRIACLVPTTLTIVRKPQMPAIRTIRSAP